MPISLMDTVILSLNSYRINASGPGFLCVNRAWSYREARQGTTPIASDRPMVWVGVKDGRRLITHLYGD
jgi:hypothetical protein